MWGFLCQSLKRPHSLWFFFYLALTVDAIDWIFCFYACPWNVADCYCTGHHVNALMLILYSLSVASQIRFWCLFSHQQYVHALHTNKNYWLSYISILTSCNIWAVLREWRIRDTDLIWLGHEIWLFFKK